MKKSSAIQVIDRMAALLDAIASYEKPVSLKFLSADTGLHTATTHRILSSLMIQGFVQRDDKSNYRLGHKLIELGCSASAHFDIREEALHILQNLRDKVDETANLTVRKGDKVVYVERAVNNRMMRVEQVIGSHAPLHVTAVGKLMLADEGDAAIDDYINRIGLSELTKHTLTDKAQFKAELKQAHEQAYALDNEEAEIGVGCIGVLVRNLKGKVVAGLSVSAPIERRSDEWIPIVIAAAKKLSIRIGDRETI